MNCVGPGCSELVGKSSLACTQTGSDSFQCTNGVTCASASGFSSNFTIVAGNTTVSQTQNASVNNGTTFTFQQDGAGDVTLANSTSTIYSNESSVATTTLLYGTPLPSMGPGYNGTSGTISLTNSSATASVTPSISKTSGASRRQSYPTLLLIMLGLCLFLGQTRGKTWTGNDIGASVEAILKTFEAAETGKSLYEITADAIAREFDKVATETCSFLLENGVDHLVGLGEAFGQCEEAMVGAEMGAIGSSVGLTLRTYAGLGGVLTTALTAADEAAVMAADASVIPEIFIVNSALCGLLIAVIEQQALEPASGNLCSALESAASNLVPTAVSTSFSTATTTQSISTTSISPTTSSLAPNPTSSLSIISVPPDSCASCQLSVYALGVQGFAASCNVATPLGSALDVSKLLCDSSYNGLYSQFCTTLCASPCATYSIKSWIQSAGSQFMPDATLATCQSLCPGFEGDGSCSGTYTCECGVGAGTCTPAGCGAKLI